MAPGLGSGIWDGDDPLRTLDFIGLLFPEGERKNVAGGSIDRRIRMDQAGWRDTPGPSALSGHFGKKKLARADYPVWGNLNPGIDHLPGLSDV